MKNAIKLKAIHRIAGIVALLAVIGLSMAACGDGDSGNKILGLPYSQKFDHQQSHGGGEITSYILDCSYDEAEKVLTQKFGWRKHQVYADGDLDVPANRAFLDYINANPDWVALQDWVEDGSYALVHWYRPDDPIYEGVTDGYSWEKPYDKEGSIRITGMPERYNGRTAFIHVVDFLNGTVDMGDNWENRVPTRQPFYGESTKISNGSVDFPLYWFPINSYDRKSGTYKHGERYTIMFAIYEVTSFWIPVITFTNGRAELDFNTLVEDPF